MTDINPLVCRVKYKPTSSTVGTVETYSGIGRVFEFGLSGADGNVRKLKTEDSLIPVRIKIILFFVQIVAVSRQNIGLENFISIVFPGEARSYWRNIITGIKRHKIVKKAS